MKFASTQNKKGFSLIEMLLVLGVLAVLLVAAFVVYPRVRDASRANNEVTNLTAIKASINNLYATKGGNYAGLNTGVANQARAFPTSMNSGTFTGTAVTSSWGAKVAVDVTTADLVVGGTTVPAGRAFTVSYDDVPDGVCLGLVSGAAGNFSQITVGGTATIVAPTAPATGGATFSPGAAAGACTGSPDVVFTST